MVLPALAVALVSSAAWGPPAVAAPGEGGGAAAGAPVPAADGGGAAYGTSKPKSEAKSRKKRRAKRSVATGVHHFPIAGPFDWGGRDARFGARRTGHRHQGQDLAAAAGTPVVAPYRGTVAYVGYQKRGAGRYVVIHAADYDYVFMHLLTGSVLVGQGERVRAGEQIASVGSTGESTGPHLHFELWVGGWYTGGRPIDPLALLQAWASPASG